MECESRNVVKYPGPSVGNCLKIATGFMGVRSFVIRCDTCVKKVTAEPPGKKYGDGVPLVFHQAVRQRNLLPALPARTPWRDIRFSDDPLSGNVRIIEIRSFMSANQVFSRLHLDLDLSARDGDAAAIRSLA